MSRHSNTTGNIGTFNKAFENNPSFTLPYKVDRYNSFYSRIYKKIPNWLRIVRRAGKTPMNSPTLP